MAELSLPASSATNGSWLRTQATHALVRSMISRDDTWHGRYGVLPGYGVSLQDGFQDTFGATATGALELGAMAYAVRSLACTSCFHSPLPPRAAGSALALRIQRGVIDNWLRYYVRGTKF